MTRRIVFRDALLFDSGAGRMWPGATVVVEGNPARDLAPLQAPARGLRAVMKAGRFYKNLL